jgi:hypothetical protein
MSIFQQVYSRDRWEGEGQTEQIGAKTLARINQTLIFLSCRPNFTPSSQSYKTYLSML